MTENKTAYQRQLADPRWQKKRLEILQRDNFTCTHCEATENELHVHHNYYKKGFKAWEYPEDCYKTLCYICHAFLSKHGVLPPTYSETAGNISKELAFSDEFMCLLWNMVGHCIDSVISMKEKDIEKEITIDLSNTIIKCKEIASDTLIKTYKGILQ